jgi:hypothetical protein
MAGGGADINAIEACTTIGPYDGGSVADFEEAARQVEARERRTSWSPGRHQASG